MVGYIMSKFFEFMDPVGKGMNDEWREKDSFEN
jgi:hypothetical protein